MKAKRSGDVRLALGLIPDRRHFTVRGNLAATLRLAEQAGRAGADLVAFEEGGISLFAPSKGKAVAVPGPETEALAAVARRWRLYVAATMIQDLGGGRKGNVVVLFDRRGRIVTVYRKQQLTIGELSGGTVPGDVCMPVETDFGRVGFLICYDTQFPELPRLLGARGVDLLIMPHVGGAGPGGGNLLGGGFANANGCWAAWVGRSGTAVISPAGVPVARMNVTGRLLVTDIAMNRTRVVPMAAETHVDWYGRQVMERRPDHYGHSAPAVEIAAPALPLHAVLSSTPGSHRIELRLRNRSAARQSGRCVVEFPRPIRYRSDEQQGSWIDAEVAGSWRPRPAKFRFDLAPGGSMPVRIDYTMPADAFGIFLLRVIGRTDGGERVFWQHQVERFPPAPSLDVPRLANPGAVMRRGARVALTHDFFGAPARSRAEMRIGWTADALVLGVRAFRFGPWKDGEGRCGEAVSFAVKPSQEKTTVFWFTVERSGRVTAQRREHGTMVRGGLPAWKADVKAGARWWDARITVPFRGVARRPAVGTTWGFNAERRAMLPKALDDLRDLAVVRTPEVNVLTASRGVGAEWVDWNPSYSRIDCIPRQGTIRFADEKGSWVTE